MELKTKLTMLFLVFAVTPLLFLGYFSYHNSSAVIIKQVCMNILENNELVQESMNYFVRDIEQLTAYIYSNTEIQRILSGQGDLRQRLADYKQMDEILGSLLGFKDWDISIYILGLNGERYFTGDLLPDNYQDFNENWGIFRRAQMANGNVVWDTHYVMNKIEDFGVVLSAGRMLKDLGTGEKLGYLVVDVSENAIADKYKRADVYPDGEMYILDRSGYIISSTPSKSRVGTKLDRPYLAQVLDNKQGYFQMDNALPDGRRGMVVFDTSELTGFKVIQVVPVDEITKVSESIKRLTMAIILVLIATAFWMAYFLSNTVTNPLRRLRRLMQEVESGNLEVGFVSKTKDEIGQLGRSFNRMLQQLQQLIREVYDKQVKLHEAELKAIYAQFNPHFLYNTLDSINWMARMYKAEPISKMAVAMGELLRFSIRRDVEFIRVREEVQQIRNYLMIQEIRYRDKFDAVIDVEPGTEELYTLKLLLQPIVENAVTHGLELKPDKGRLSIRIYRDAGRLCMEVVDDGMGMDAELAERLRRLVLTSGSTPGTASGTASGSPTGAPSGSTPGSMDAAKTLPHHGHTGIGFENVVRRLQLHFPGRHRLYLHSEPGQGTHVRIEIPIIEEAAQYVESHAG
jgi:two-component system sensor histidine kinase YesM